MCISANKCKGIGVNLLSNYHQWVYSHARKVYIDGKKDKIVKKKAISCGVSEGGQWNSSNDMNNGETSSDKWTTHQGRRAGCHLGHVRTSLTTAISHP